MMNEKEIGRNPFLSRAGFDKLAIYLSEYKPYVVAIPF